MNFAVTLVKKSLKHFLWGYAFLLIILAYFFGLFIDLTGDSGLYATIARQMVESGDWLTLKINGELYDQKPHLIFWLAGAGIKIFGNTNLAFKIFPTLWALAGIFFTYRLGKLLYSEAAGKFAALIAGTSQIFMLYLFDIHTDTILQTGVVLAVWQLVAYLRSNKPIHFILGFAGVGLAMLSKGPVGVVVPFFVLLFYLVFQKDYHQIFQVKWFLGIGIALVVTSPALIHLYKSFGTEGIRFFFITNNFGRISGEYAGSSNDPFYYIYNLVWSFLPWTVFVFFALFSEIKSWFSKVQKDIWGIALLGSVLVFTFILSIAKGKAPNYFLLAIPLISIITGKWMNFAFESKKNHNLFLIQRIFLLVYLMFFVFVIYVFRVISLFIPGILLISLGIILFIANKKLKGETLVVFYSMVICGTFYLYINVLLAPKLFSYQGARQVLEKTEGNQRYDDVLYNLHLREFELFYYAEEPVIQIHTHPDYLEMLKQNDIWIYTTEAGYNRIIKDVEKVDTVYFINQRGMNKISINFLNPDTREENLEINYLIKK